MHRSERPHRFPATRWLAIRRWIDAGVVLVALPVCGPLAIASTVLVGVVDRHSPIVTLMRVGRFGEPLPMRKIRSMRSTPATGARITVANDTRVTAVGKVIRSWRLDELPQLVSVLIGSMALIGPRPEDPAFVDLDDQRWLDVLAVRPAIAGLSQIAAAPWEESELSADAPERYVEEAVPAKLAIDGWYARHASPRVDMIIVRSLAEQFLLGRSWTTAHQLLSDEVPQAERLLEAARKARPA